jgi:NADH-quinone oxidoreductase subunit L
VTTPAELGFPAALMLWAAWLLPLVAAAAITLSSLNKPAVSARLSIGAVLASFGLSVLLFAQRARGETAVNWLSLAAGGESLNVEMGLRLDGLSALMLLVVTGVGGAIHVYSWGYMRQEQGVGRYFAGLSFFTFSMLGVVLATNFLMLFIFWELVGVSSWLLIGFWHERPAAANAAKKAFLTNRVGDFGFLLGILVLWAAYGSLDFAELSDRLEVQPEVLGALAPVAALLIFSGAVGKSAQFPLHVWLPDAMEGPTPVSALIHAATMVAAGVYMLCRVFFLLAVDGSWALEVIAWTGGLTALLAALMAVQQNDIKRILAYSTVSQLGYMVMAVGLAGASRSPAAAMYHLTTHAFFKALLFLGAGAVIHALAREQDIWRMGGLTRKMPVTFWCFLVATLALCGAPPLSGFFSKDAILALAYEQRNYGLFALAAGTVALTAFYMFRLLFVAFIGPAKSRSSDYAHEAPVVMVLPLLALAAATVLAGFWGLDRLYGEHFAPGSAAEAPGWTAQLAAPFHHAPWPAALGLVAAAAGFLAAWKLYWNKVHDPLPQLLGPLAVWMRDRFYFDELYRRLIGWSQEALAELADAVDRWVIAGMLVRGTHGCADLTGRLLRLVQTGNPQTYAFLLAAGLALMLFCVLFC